LPKHLDLARPFRDRDEDRRRHLPAFGIVPSQQSFQPDNAARTQIDFRLIVEFELLAVDRAAQFIGDDDALLDLAIEVGVVKAEAIAAILLGAIKRKA